MAECVICEEDVVTHNYLRATFGANREETAANAVFIDLSHTMEEAIAALPEPRPLFLRWNPRGGVRQATLDRMADRAGISPDLGAPENVILEMLFTADPALGSLTMRTLEGLGTSGLFRMTIEDGTDPASVLDIIPWEQEKPRVVTPADTREASRILVGRKLLENPELNANLDKSEEN
jgi:hypothetical protein